MDIDKKDKFGYSVLENTGAPIVVLDLQGRIVLFNPASEKLSGYRFSDLKGQYFWEMLSAAEDADSMRESGISILVKEIQQGAVRRTFCWQDKQGKNHFVEWVITPLFSNNGKVENIILTGLDETDHHQYELALAHNEARYRDIVETSQEGIYTINAENRTTFVNPRMAAMLGYSVEELLGKSVFDFVDEQGQEKVKQALERRKAGVQEQHEIQIQHNNGTPIWVQLNATPLLNEQGVYIGALAMATDITERKLMEDALRESELWMKNIFNSLEEAVLVVSPERELINVNQAALNIFGYTLEEIMTSSTELFHVDHQHYLEFGETINKAFSENKTANFEFVARRKNGEIFPSEHTVSLLKDPEGKVKGIVSVVRDITERKNAQDELEKHRANLEEMVAERTLELRNAQEELVRKERLATLGQLTATVSHELRNPLSAMRPTMYLIKQHYGNNADKELVNAIKRLDRNITRCDHIIDELLDFTRITDLDKKETLLDKWLDSVVEENFDLENVTIQKEYSLEGVRVPLDTSRLQRAIINVIENAYHAMHGSKAGSNKTAEARLKIETRADGDRIEISISDTGPGIPEDVFPKIFEPLFSTKNFGVGLGMPTVQQIMTQHGGGIDVSSREGEGTTVTLWLPEKGSG